MNLLFKSLRLLLSALFAALTIGILVLAGASYYLAPGLPSTENIKSMPLQVPLRVYSQDERLIAEFGEKRRQPVTYEQLPPMLIAAVIAAEDNRFFEHPGVDYQGLLRAGLELARTGEKRQGGSTITMQLARNYFLTREKTYLRKLREILLALKLERELNKQEILTLYLNKIYLGQRAYGVGAAAQVYYGARLDELTLAQMAMLAGLPKAPSRDNPVTNPERALARRNFVLGRMQELGQIDEETYKAAIAEPDQARLHAAATEAEAPYLAEMVRAELIARFGEAAYTDGYRVFTTVRSDWQQAANAAMNKALREYDERHGYRGPEQHVDLTVTTDTRVRQELLEALPTIGGLRPALVMRVDEQAVGALLASGEEISLDWAGLKWASPYKGPSYRGPAPKTAADVVQPGDVIRVAPGADNTWRLAQVPDAEGALVALDPTDGAITALVGGFDFFHSKFNRAVQAQRQPGSSFKPFLYSAALERGFTPATLINDAPVVFQDAGLENTWRPENYSGKFHGPTRLREALVHSRNLVSIRLLRAIGVDTGIEHAKRFGFASEELPRNLSLSLGTGTLSPLRLVSAYAVFANGGYRVEPYFIERIVDNDGNALFTAEPRLACTDCGSDATATTLPVRMAPAVISPRNAWLMTSMMQDVIRRGTGRRAMELGRKDLAGKTGTTNDQRDAWFCGFNRKLAATAWVGFDDVRPLGHGETGGRAALPMWMAFMAEALRGMPEQTVVEPADLITVRIDPGTGLQAGTDQGNAVAETFFADRPPGAVRESGPAAGAPLPEQLF